MTKTTTVQMVDLWTAIDALDALPETHNTDWYKRLVEAAEAATQLSLLPKAASNRSDCVGLIRLPFNFFFDLRRLLHTGWRDTHSQ